MQIHEITLKEARPMAQPVAQNVAKLKQQRQARSVAPVTQAQPQPQPQPQATAVKPTWTDRAHQVADYFLHKNPALYAVPRWKPQGQTQAQPQAVQPQPQPQAVQPQPQPQAVQPQPQPAPVPAIQYPPITLGSGPKAQVYVNKGRGYVDSKTGKPMPPAIIKAMGIK